MNRYLLNISYIGTNFRGLQKTIDKSKIVPNDNTSIQGAIELALERFKPINEINLVLSSRTDAGVHAIQSSVHVDLERKNSLQYDPRGLTFGLNNHFHKNSLPIRILSTEHVPDTFHARYSVKSRTYLYRFAVNADTSIIPKGKYGAAFLTNYLPIEEIDRCFFITNNLFDAKRAIAAANLFVGCHDFRTFMATSRNNTRDHAFFALRTIYSVSLKPSQSFAGSFSCEKANKKYNYWDLKITGRSFLYRQIRRMVATILAVGQHKLTVRDVYEMLTVPSPHSWCPQAVTAPPHGLYLCKVEYNDKDKQFRTT